MLQFPSIDPVLLSLGPVKIHWYGVMYLLAFVAAWFVGMSRAKKANAALKVSQIEDLIFYGAVGVVLGGRLGYVFFYGFDQFINSPLWLFKIWEGGMSFHGGLLGVFVAIILYARKIGVPLGAACDFVAPLAPIGLGLGRLANFINGELYGRVTDVSWAMVFPSDTLQLPRHPSQLYQFALEGVALFLIVFWFSRKPRPAWSVTGVFLVAYGVFRSFVEFFRQPDAAVWFDWLTRGQLLSLPMIIGGAVLIFVAYRRQFASDESGKAPHRQKLSMKKQKKRKKNRKIAR